MATNYFQQPAFSPRADVITVRPSSTALLTIDSEDRFQNGYDASGNRITGYPYARIQEGILAGNNASPYDFTIVKNESIMNGFFTRLGLTEVNFEWGVPNINFTTNRIYVNYHNLSTNASGTSLVKLFDGEIVFATPYQIASNLQSNVRATGVTDLSQFTITYGEPNYIDPSGNVFGQGNGYPIFRYYGGLSGNVMNPKIQVSFSPLAYNNNNSNSPSAYPYDVYTKQLFDLMGFNKFNTTFKDEAVGKTTFCQATRYIDIVCSQLAYNQPLKDTTTAPVVRDSLCRLYISDINGFQQNSVPCWSPSFTPAGCAPATIYRQFQTPKMINWYSAGPNYQPVQGVLRFEVLNDAGSNLNQLCYDPAVNPTQDPNDIEGINIDALNWSATILVSEN